MENIITVADIDLLIKEIFEDNQGMVKSVDSVYEKVKDSDNYKLVISIHQLEVGKNTILHTKFIFFLDAQKQVLINRTFSYLYDINCHYKLINFTDVNELKNKINNLINKNKFGKDLITLSEFLQKPVSNLNNYLERDSVESFTIYDFKYEPKFKIQPCQDTEFDFIINIDNNYNIEVNLRKDVQEKKYRIRYKYLDNIVVKDYQEIQPITAILSNDISKIMKQFINDKQT